MIINGKMSKSKEWKYQFNSIEFNLNMIISYSLHVYTQYIPICPIFYLYLYIIILNNLYISVLYTFENRFIVCMQTAVHTHT